MSDIAQEAQQILGAILSLMGLEASVASSAGEDGRIFLVIESDISTHPITIGRYGSTLDALQVVVTAILSNKKKASVPVVVDIGGYRKRREESLKNIASSAADDAIDKNRPVHLDPMPPTERRVIHMAAASDERVSTRSEGEGHDRHIVIFPKGFQEGSLS